MMTLPSTPNAVQQARLTALGLHLIETQRAGVSVWSLELRNGYWFAVELDDAAQPEPAEIMKRIAAEAFLAGEREKAAEIRRILGVGGR